LQFLRVTVVCHWTELKHHNALLMHVPRPSLHAPICICENRSTTFQGQDHWRAKHHSWNSMFHSFQRRFEFHQSCNTCSHTWVKRYYVGRYFEINASATKIL